MPSPVLLNCQTKVLRAVEIVNEISSSGEDVSDLLHNIQDTQILTNRLILDKRDVDDSLLAPLSQSVDVLLTLLEKLVFSFPLISELVPNPNLTL